MPLTQTQLNANKASSGGHIGPTGVTIAAVDLTDGATLAMPKHILIFHLLGEMYKFYGQSHPAGYSDKGEAQTPRGPFGNVLKEGVHYNGRLYTATPSYPIGITTGMTAGTYPGFILRSHTKGNNGALTLVAAYWIPYDALEDFNPASCLAVAITA